MNCPICKSINSTKPRIDLQPHPYVECADCGLYYQPEYIPKVYEAFHEIRGDLMSDQDKQVNNNLAQALYHNHLSKLNKDNYHHLDIGSKFPFLGHCLQQFNVSSTAIDGIDEVIEFGQKLNVKAIQGDFEKDQIEFDQKFDLITLVHCAEHFYNPINVFKKIRNIINDDGIIFIRVPDSGTSGIERDFTVGHYDIHPLIWCEKALYEMLFQLKDCFEVYETYSLGYGQRDYLLKAIKKEPTVGIGLIVKDGEKEIERCLKSFETCAKTFNVIVNNTTDNTFSIALNIIESFKDKVNNRVEDIKYQNFSFDVARNQYVDYLNDKVDFILQLDIDDVSTKDFINEINRLKYSPYDMIGVQYKTGANSSHLHYRFFRTGKNIKYQGKCHEYLVYNENKYYETKAEVIHDPIEKDHYEKSAERNINILLNIENKSPRDLFYLANSLRDGGRFEEAIQYYQQYINNSNVFYHDEYMHAWFYLARCFRFLDKPEQCIQIVEAALKIDSSWAELYIEASYVYYYKYQNWELSYDYAEKASKLIYRSRLFSEADKYQDVSYRYMTWCRFNQQRYSEALNCADPVLKWAPNDQDWLIFIDRIKSSITLPLEKISNEDILYINLLRPGAAGDVIMIGAITSGLKSKYPSAQINLYTKYLDIGKILQGVDNVFDSDLWNQRKQGIDYSLIGYPLNEGYPYKPMKKHLIEYFCKEVGLDYPQKIKLDQNKIVSVLQEDLKYITIHCKAGWSEYKNWPTEKWNQLIKLIKQDKDLQQFKIIQIGGKEDPILEEIDISLLGLPFKQIFSVIKNSRLHLGIDSFSNHVAGAFEVSSIILFGSTSPIGSGYGSSKNIWKQLKCSPCYKEDPKISSMSLGVCPYLINGKCKCMEEISVSEVFVHIKNDIK